MERMWLTPTIILFLYDTIRYIFRVYRDIYIYVVQSW